MKFRLRLFLSFSAFLLASSILAVSLVTTDVASAGDVTMSNKRFYMGQVMPDHVLYPALMAMDRFYLEISDPKERIYKQIEYANRRLFYTKELLESCDEEKQEIALSTLSKSAKYMIKAALEVQTLEEDKENTQDFVLKSLKNHSQELEKLTQQFPDYQRPILDQLKDEERAMITQLDK